MEPPTSTLLLPGSYPRCPSYLSLKPRPHTTSQKHLSAFVGSRTLSQASNRPLSCTGRYSSVSRVPFDSTKLNEVYITSLVSSPVPHPTPMQGSTYPSRSRSPAQQEVEHVSGPITKRHSPRLKTEALF